MKSIRFILLLFSLPLLCVSFSTISAESFGFYVPDKVLCQYQSYRTKRTYLRQFNEKCPRRWRQISKLNSPEDIDGKIAANNVTAERAGARFSPLGCFTVTKKEQYSSLSIPFDGPATLSVSASCNEIRSPGFQNAVMVNSGFHLSSALPEVNTDCSVPDPIDNGDGTFSIPSVSCNVPLRTSFSNGSNQTLVSNMMKTIKTNSGSDLADGRRIITEVNLEGLQEYAQSQGRDEALAVAELQLYCCPAGNRQ